MGSIETETQYGLLDAIDAGIIVLDRQGRIEGWNAWMLSATGKSFDSVHGKQLAEVFPASGLDLIDSAVANALASGTPSLLTHVLHPSLFPLKTRAGRNLLHDTTVAPAGPSPFLRCVIHITDVSMALHRERFLRDRQNARYEAVTESAVDAILTLDCNGAIQQANPAAVLQLGYPFAELIGKNIATFLESGEPWTGAWSRLSHGERILKPVELVATRKDGTPTYIEVSASRWQTDSRIFITAILRDVNARRAADAALRASEAEARSAAGALADLNATLEQRVRERTDKLMEAEESLRQSQKMEAIGQLTGGIAHDFNNLLQGIIGALDMVQKRTSEGRIGDIGRFVQAAMASANRASSLTHRLLAFSRRQPVDPRPLDINQLIGTMEELLRRSIGEKIQMKAACDEPLWIVRCDANQLENALLNIAINARDAMPDGGAMTIATGNVVLDVPQALARDVAPGEYVRLSVTDTGVGMPADVLARAFDPFYTTKPIGQGTGLGLSMIYGFVRQSEGSVLIDSKPGRGTTIEICLPRFNGKLAPDIDSKNILLDRHAGEDQVVLVVEDEDVVRLLVVEVLNDIGYRALEAIDGSSALRILQSSQRIDLLVTDIGLPDLNGRQLADAAREKRTDLKILFMTGYAEKAAGGSFLAPGMEIVSKPFTMDDLAQKIQEMIKG